MTALLKKLGIVAAVSAAGLIAVSPLALAGEDGKHHKKDPHVNDSQICKADQSYGGLINLLNLANGNVLSCNDINVQVGLANTNEQ